jgi:allantoate deiminase
MTSTANAAYVLELCARIAAETDVQGTITRTYLSPATHAVHELLRAEMESLGMAVRIDAAGNLRGLYPAQDSLSFRSAAEESAFAFPTPILLMGSHIDTVPDAGAYDGILGVALPIALLHSLEGSRFPFAIEIVAFSEEEGIRFKMPFIGSRALVGALGDAELARTDADGITLAQAIRDFGLDPGDIAGAAITPGTFAFLEVHIEQGPVLESLGLPLGIVDAIAGQARFELTFTGHANHAGTTPMHLRRDAIAAAAEWMVEVERFAQNTDGLVATIGSIHAHPGAANVVPGSAILSLDVRHASDETRLHAAAALLAEAEHIARSRNIGLRIAETSEQSAIAMSPGLRDALAAASPAAHGMVSGAGHDAMILAPHLPSAMLFVRSPGGVSHHPSEAVLVEDIQAALGTCLRFLEALNPPTKRPA